MNLCVHILRLNHLRGKRPRRVGEAQRRRQRFAALAQGRWAGAQGGNRGLHAQTDPPNLRRDSSHATRLMQLSWETGLTFKTGSNSDSPQCVIENSQIDGALIGSILRLF